MSRFWLKFATFGFRGNGPDYKFRPGDEERLLQALVNMNAVLARAARI